MIKFQFCLSYLCNKEAVNWPTHNPISGFNFFYPRVNLVVVLPQRNIWPTFFMLSRNEYIENTYFWFSPFISRNSSITSHISWSLHDLCRMCCCAQLSHNGSRSSHVLQKWVALVFKSPKRQGSHKTSVSLHCFSLLSFKKKFFLAEKHNNKT